MPLSNLWLSFLFVLQCGNFAVLVDLHVLPPGGGEDASWFTTDRVEVEKLGGRGEEGVGVNKRATECIGPRLRGVFSKREHRRGIRNDFEPSMYSFV